MSHIIIKNFGPIKEAEFETKKVTVFIGNQSSGKSTIAKVVSFCSWMEKEALIRQDLSFVDEEFVKKQFLEFHKMTSYPNAEFLIKYTGESIIFEYSDEIHISWNSTSAGQNNKICKVSYIPSIRNLVAMHGFETLNLSNNYIRSFLFDWANVKRKIIAAEKIDILNLGVSYNFDADAGDTIKIDDNGKIILFDEASSGLQSIIPLYIMTYYMTEWIYENGADTSYEKDAIKLKTIENELRRLTNNTDNTKTPTELLSLFTDQISNLIIESNETNTTVYDQISSNVDYKRIKTLINNILNIHYSHLIIEEPEQNLFPKTQRDLMYYLLKVITYNKRDHKLLLTTHSPYILYALNNCMMGGLLGDKIEKIKSRIVCGESFIKPSDVVIIGVENGTIKFLQQKDGLISNNYFEENMKGLMDDFYKMLNFYGNDKE